MTPQERIGEIQELRRSEMSSERRAALDLELAELVLRIAHTKPIQK